MRILANVLINNLVFSLFCYDYRLHCVFVVGLHIFQVRLNTVPDLLLQCCFNLLHHHQYIMVNCLFGICSCSFVVMHVLCDYKHVCIWLDVVDCGILYQHSYVV